MTPQPGEVVGERYGSEVDKGLPSGTEVKAESAKKRDRSGSRTRRKPGECNSQHQLVSFALTAMVEPRSNTLIQRYEVMCCRCGRTLDEVRKEHNAR